MIQEKALAVPVESIGIKETKEALEGIMQISLLMADVLKDGAQIGDIGAVFAKFTADAAFRKKIELAFEGMGKIPPEMGDLQSGEVIELTMLMAGFIPQFLAIFAKKIAMKAAIDV